MQYKMIQKTQWQAQKISASDKCFGQQYNDFVVFYIAFVFRPQLGFQLGFSKLYSKLSVVKYNVTVKFGTNCLELTPWKFTPFGFSPGSVVNYKLLRASYKSMESMEIIFHSVIYFQCCKFQPLCIDWSFPKLEGGSSHQSKLTFSTMG